MELPLELDGIRGRRFVVIGAFQADCLVRTSELPQWDQGVSLVPGGKALNQAVALAGLGASVVAVGVAGTDPAGAMVLESLRRHGIRTELVRRGDGSTPICFCFVGDDGQTSFLSPDPGAMAVTAADIRRAEPEIRSADGILMTYEVSSRAARGALESFRGAGGIVAVQPSPPLPGARDLPYDGVDVLLPNEAEARALLSSDGTGDRRGLPEALHRVTGVPEIVVTCGADGCLGFDGHGTTGFPAQPVPAVVDTTGASDAFAAHYMAARIIGAPVPQATRGALAAAAYSIQRPGGYHSMPPGRIDEAGRAVRDRSGRSAAPADRRSGPRQIGDLATGR